MVNPVPSAAPVRSPAPMKLACWDCPWNVVGPVGVGKCRVTTRSLSSATRKVNGSLSSSAPRFMVAVVAPVKVSGRTDAGSMSERSSGVAVFGRATVARPTLTACSP